MDEDLPVFEWANVEKPKVEEEEVKACDLDDTECISCGS